MKDHILQQFIGRQIQKVRYFELNDPENPFFFEDFDNCDLGIEIEFSDSLYWHIGWKNEDCPEIGLGTYDYTHYHENAQWIDATDRWSEHINSPIQDIELIYVSEELRIPAKCTLHFENRPSLTIVVGEELNVDRTIPYPLSYREVPEIYVFFKLETLPKIELVRIEQPPEYFEMQQDYDLEESEKRIERYKQDKSAFNTIVLVLAIIGALYLIVFFAL